MACGMGGDILSIGTLKAKLPAPKPPLFHAPEIDANKFGDRFDFFDLLLLRWCKRHYAPLPHGPLFRRVRYDSRRITQIPAGWRDTRHDSRRVKAFPACLSRSPRRTPARGSGAGSPVPSAASRTVTAPRLRGSRAGHRRRWWRAPRPPPVRQLVSVS
jgi:hypothetical protein